MKKILAITFILVLIVTSFAGCAKPAVKPEPDAPEPTAAPEQNTSTGSEASEKIVEKEVDIQGKLNGWIDSNSVEIEICSEDTLAFRVTDVLDQLDGINDGDMVKFSYEANENAQLIITKIEKVK